MDKSSLSCVGLKRKKKGMKKMKILKKVLSAVIAGSMLASMFTVAQAKTIVTDKYVTNFDSMTDDEFKAQNGNNPWSYDETKVKLAEFADTNENKKFSGKSIELSQPSALSFNLANAGASLGKKYHIEFDMRQDTYSGSNVQWTLVCNGSGIKEGYMIRAWDNTWIDINGGNSAKGTASTHFIIDFDLAAKTVTYNAKTNRDNWSFTAGTKTLTGLTGIPNIKLYYHYGGAIRIDNFQFTETTYETHVPVTGELFYQDFDDVAATDWANLNTDLWTSKGSTKLVAYRDTDCGKKFTGNAIQIPSNTGLTFNLSNYGLTLNKKYVMEFDLRQDVQANSQNLAVRAMSGNNQVAMLARTMNTNNWLSIMEKVGGNVSKSLHFALTLDMKEKTISTLITDNKNNFSFATQTTGELDITAVPDIQIVSNTGAVYLDNILIIKEIEPESFEVKTFKFAKNTIDDIKAADTIVVNAMYKSTYEDAQPVKVLLAFYNGEQLVDAQIVSHDAVTGTKQLKSEFTQPSAGYTSVKAMMWNGFNSMVPYCGAIELPAAE